MGMGIGDGEKRGDRDKESVWRKVNKQLSNPNMERA